MERDFPEIFFGLVGPIGTDIDCVETELTSALHSMKYSVIPISVSNIIKSFSDPEELGSNFELIENPPESPQAKIDAGNKIRALTRYPDFLSKAVCLNIRTLRYQHWDKMFPLDQNIVQSDDALNKRYNDLTSRPIPKAAYIIRQLKRPEEVNLLRKVYGRHFFLISATASSKARKAKLVGTLGKKDANLDEKARSQLADQLIFDDAEQADKNYGQLVSETFHLGDFFVDATRRDKVQPAVSRFVRGIFGSNRISPTRDEFGSYFAKAASLKSIDTSRQVGAALFTNSGDIITTGCNDVAKATGGHFWEEDDEKHRDMDVGTEFNKEETNRIIHDFLKTLIAHNVIKVSDEQQADIHEIKKLTPEKILEDSKVRTAISESMIGEITEYGRMIHAEMSALTDAARLGRSVKDAVLYVTTYPCHNCAKHIVASGVMRVVYIEPYPKSRASSLYGHAIREESETGGVAFQHFFGISPRIYKHIFEKTKKRRDKATGAMIEWESGEPFPFFSKQTYDTIEADEAALVLDTVKALKAR